MTFSFIVPVYNTEKYLPKCLDSLLAQTYPDFEIIVVNDGTPDNSQAIIDEYVAKHPNKIRSFIKENGGLSDARNFGIARASGDYLLFIDSDDYISPTLLEQLSVAAGQGVDVIRFNAQFVSREDQLGTVISAPKIDAIPGPNALLQLIEHKEFFEPACFYAYRRAYWLENGYQYAKGMYHEDFGLTPEVIIKAASVTAIDHVGYFYVQTPGSIMRSSNPEKDRKRAFDSLQHFDHLVQVANNSISNPTIRKIFLSYIANSAIVRLEHVSGTAKTDYLKAVRERKVFDLLLDDTLPRKLKKLLLKCKYIYFSKE